MPEKPILFNTEMVRALLDGRKTQTRRVIKGLPLQEPHATVDKGDLWIEDEDGNFWRAEYFSKIQPGDMLWVRETWAEMPYGYVYRADEEEPEGWDPDDRWHPSIHMPREAARIFLKVTGVRVERLQNLTKRDMLDEGVSISLAVMFGKDELKRQFIDLWNGTIKKSDLTLYGWDTNPWVWVIEFERAENGGAR